MDGSSDRRWLYQKGSEGDAGRKGHSGGVYCLAEGDLSATLCRSTELEITECCVLLEHAIDSWYPRILIEKLIHPFSNILLRVPPLYLYSSTPQISDILPLDLASTIPKPYLQTQAIVTSVKTPLNHLTSQLQTPAQNAAYRSQTPSWPSPCFAYQQRLPGPFPSALHKQAFLISICWVTEWV